MTGRSNLLHHGQINSYMYSDSIMVKLSAMLKSIGGNFVMVKQADMLKIVDGGSTMAKQTAGCKESYAIMVKKFSYAKES